MEFIASYLEITCVYYILLDNHDLQSCQVGQGKDVAITTPAQLTLCSLGHQAVPWLAGGLDSMWHISTNGFWSEKNSLISVWLQIARQCFQPSTWSVLPRVTTSWGLNTFRLNIISKLFDRTTIQWNYSFLCGNCQLAPPTWAIMKDSARFTRSGHLNVKLALKSELRPTRWRIKLSIIQNTRWVKTVTFSHHKSSQRIDTWQPTDREDTMPSWTEPTLDQLIIGFNASKSINYATPMWNKHIYLTSNSVETNTHVSTLHSMIRKQLSKIGQSTEWHFNTQTPVGVQISLRYSNIKGVRLTSPQYPVAHLGHQQLSCWTWHSWPESSHSSLPHKQGKSEGFESCDWPIVRKRPIWVKIGDALYRVTLKFDGWPALLFQALCNIS